jgi:hypothetical protein
VQGLSRDDFPAALSYRQKKQRLNKVRGLSRASYPETKFSRKVKLHAKTKSKANTSFQRSFLNAILRKGERHPRGDITEFQKFPP